MSQQELLTYVAGALRRLGVSFMLTGSHASSVQGEVRSTHDIDLVCRLQESDVGPLLSEFADDRFYLSESAVRAAIRARRMFNLLEVRTGEKVDFWLLTESPFDQARFARRRPIMFDGVRLEISSPEDTILMKPLWSEQSGGGEKQFLDALRVYELQSSLLDVAYLETWAAELGLTALWQRLTAEAVPYEPPAGFAGDA